MAVFELTLDTISLLPVLLTDGAGGAVTAVLKAQIDPYFVKAGGAATQLPAADFDWAEIDAANMPGQYTLTINAVGVANSRLDTMGVFLLTIKEDAVGPPVFVAYPTISYVVPLVTWDLLRRLRAWSGVNYRIFPVTYDSVSGEIKTGSVKIYPDAASAAADVNVIETGTLTAAYDVNGRVTSYRITV